MLYHSDNISAALSEIRKVLRPNGSFYATTSGLDHLIELKEMVCEFDSRIQFPLNGENRKFCLENGESVLNRYFNTVQCLRFHNSLRIDDIDYLYQFILSFKDDRNYNVNPIIENPSKFKTYLNSKTKGGCIEVTKSNCIFISSNI